MEQKDIEKLRSVINKDDVFNFSLSKLKEYITLLHAPEEYQCFTGDDYKAINNKLKLALELRIKHDQDRATDEHYNKLEKHLNELKKPHWSVVPTFWFALISAIAAIVAIFLKQR